eukprot:scaffold596_cov378-Prasinococcus_capsulatus_cf.AAC.3
MNRPWRAAGAPPTHAAYPTLGTPRQLARVWRRRRARHATTACPSTSRLALPADTLPLLSALSTAACVAQLASGPAWRLHSEARTTARASTRGVTPALTGPAPGRRHPQPQLNAAIRGAALRGAAGGRRCAPSTRRRTPSRAPALAVTPALTVWLCACS